MNEQTDDTAVVALRARHQTVIDEIQKLQEICESPTWVLIESTIQDEVATLEKRLLELAKDTALDSNEIYRVQGQLYFAKRYDFKKKLENYRLELTNIKNRINTYVKNSPDRAGYSS